MGSRADTIIETARSLIGTPYRHQGRSTAGVDCAGLMVLACRAAGYEVKDWKGYGRTPHGGKLEAAMDRNFIRVPSTEPGDFLLMRFDKQPQHIAIYTGRTIIHAYSNVGRVVEQRYADVWRARVMVVYRLV